MTDTVHVITTLGPGDGPGQTPYVASSHCRTCMRASGQHEPWCPFHVDLADTTPEG